VNRTNFALLALFTLATGVGCSDNSSDNGTGGAAGTGATGGTTGGAGGGAGTGGQAAGAGTGGTTGGSAGSTSGAGGSTGGTTGGTSGAGGAGPAGTGGMAGSVAAGTGGTAGTDAGSGGMAGAGLDPDTIVPGLEGMYWELRTMNEAAPTDPRKYWLTDTAADTCPAGADWATSGLDRTKVITAAGTPGQKYTINFQLRALMALRCYEGGTPSDMMPNATATNDTFYVGGMPFGDSPVNTYQLAVTPAVTGETSSTYFLNGIPSSSGMCDTGITYEVAYTNKFVIMGDSTITLSNHLSDCQALQNCGPSATGDCAPRTVNMDNFMVRASPYQPVANIFNDTTFYPQWVAIDVLEITSP